MLVLTLNSTDFKDKLRRAIAEVVKMLEND